MDKYYSISIIRTLQPFQNWGVFRTKQRPGGVSRCMYYNNLEDIRVFMRFTVRCPKVTGGAALPYTVPYHAIYHTTYHTMPIPYHVVPYHSNYTDSITLVDHVDSLEEKTKIFFRKCQSSSVKKEWKDEQFSKIQEVSVSKVVLVYHARCHMVEGGIAGL